MVQPVGFVPLPFGTPSEKQLSLPPVGLVPLFGTLFALECPIPNRSVPPCTTYITKGLSPLCIQGWYGLASITPIHSEENLRFRGIRHSIRNPSS